MMCFRDMTFCDSPCRNKACDRMLTRRVVRDANRWWRRVNAPGSAPIARSAFHPNCPDFMPHDDTIDSRRELCVTVEAVPEQVCGAECYGMYHRTVEVEMDEHGRQRTMRQYKVFKNPAEVPNTDKLLLIEEA